MLVISRINLIVVFLFAMFPVALPPLPQEHFNKTGQDTSTTETRLEKDTEHKRLRGGSKSEVGLVSSNFAATHVAAGANEASRQEVSTENCPEPTATHVAGSSRLIQVPVETRRRSQFGNTVIPVNQSFGTRSLAVMSINSTRQPASCGEDGSAEFATRGRTKHAILLC